MATVNIKKYIKKSNKNQQNNHPKTTTTNKREENARTHERTHARTREEEKQRRNKKRQKDRQLFRSVTILFRINKMITMTCCTFLTWQQAGMLGVGVKGEKEWKGEALDELIEEKSQGG